MAAVVRCGNRSKQYQIKLNFDRLYKDLFELPKNLWNANIRPEIRFPDHLHIHLYAGIFL